MKNFNQIYQDYLFILSDSVLDIPRNSLDPAVWSFPEGGGLPIMHAAIKNQILADITKINDIIHVTDFFVKGSILTPQYNQRTDIDVLVQVNKDDLDDLKIQSLQTILSVINKRLAQGTLHPIEYYIQQMFHDEPYDEEFAEGIYDVANEKWVRVPKQFDVDVQRFMNRFKDAVESIDLSAGELRRDIIDYEELNDAPPEHIRDLKYKLREKLIEIEDDILDLIEKKKNAVAIRRSVFQNKLSPAEIRKFGHQNRLPGNIIFKMLQRYYYFNFIKKLQEILGEEEVLKPEDIEKIKKAGQDLWK